MTRIIRNLGIIALLPLFGLVFWVAATVASSLLGLDVIGVNVHGPGLASYAGELYARPAPLSGQIGLDAQQDATGNPGTTLPPTPTPATAAQATPTPAPTRPASPTPTPLPVPTPTPGLLPVPVTSILPVPSILPSLLPGLIK